MKITSKIDLEDKIVNKARKNKNEAKYFYPQKIVGENGYCFFTETEIKRSRARGTKNKEDADLLEFVETKSNLHIWMFITGILVGAVSTYFVFGM